MDAKKYLQQLRRQELLIQQRKQELAHLRLTLDGLGSTDFSRERVQGGLPNNSAVEVKVVQLCELEHEIDDMFDDYLKLLGVIIRQILCLSNQYQIQLLFKRYIEGKKLCDIAQEMGYSLVHIKRLHKKSLLDFAKLIPNDTK